ncbi:serine/threonine-protein kinase [Streptomyces fulvoviolaceus]|uniref:serine/threonine-protein kinase n=1 Tax=Streptomyces fulvoviolaceus TaxID=285535 RepID=UPI0021C15D92|nr:serine/threonine-protein kinase [Streptomyces fulvoviolaceus]MCT9077839.1 serine/threonine-protein kinase [Streptomyces fulvoviolaceus]
MPLHKDDPKSVGGYKLVDRLGAGGMGVVYWGRSRSGRDVAVKVVHAQYAEDKVFRARFRQEIEAVRKVSGAFTAPVVDADPEAVRPWMATQYVPGSSLAQRIRDHGALKGTELRRLALGLVEALRDIHRAGVVHRDLKPANVLIAEDGIRVIDFGISRAAENHQTLTETGQMIGTPPFMSPEQFTDARTVGPASDVFSLGALLVFSATGRGPFDTDSPYLTAFRVVHEAPVLDGVAQPLRGVLERCLSKEPGDRPELDRLAQEFADVLPESHPDDPHTVTLRADVLRTVEATSSGADPAAVTKLPKVRRRGRRLRPLVAAGTVGAVALGTLWYIRFGPGFADSPRTTSPSATTAASRWAAVPTGWQAWRTTMFETAQSGEVNPLAKAGEDTSDATCQRYENAVYCAGNTILPVRLDGRTGATVWRSALATSAEGTDSSGNNFTLLGVRDDAMILQHDVFAADGSSKSSIVALDTETGDQLWARDRGGPSADQLVAGDLVMTPDSSGRLVTARSPRTGTDHWTTQLPSGDFCTFETADSRLYAHCFPDDESKDAVLLELDKTDGTVRRRLSTPNGSGLLGTVDGRLVVAVAVDGGSGPARLDQKNTFDEIRLLDPDTGATTTTELTKTYTGSIRLAADTVWITGANGQVTAVSPLTGKQLWQTRTSVEESGQPTYDPTTHTLYLASISGRVAALDSRKGTLLRETGAQADQLASGATIKSKVSLYGGAVVVNTPDGTVFSLDPAHPEG